jgi:hypothetical protein
MLERFERHGIQATWATVGATFCASREELFDALPPEELRPRYVQAALSNYRYLDEVGPDETRDPHYFGASVVAQIAACPGQEIATHTMSHFYCLEVGSAPKASPRSGCCLWAGCTVGHHAALDRVSPQPVCRPHLDAVRQRGIRCYRGNPGPWPNARSRGPDKPWDKPCCAACCG